METRSETLESTPPRLFASLKTGFDAVASHIGLILFPVVFDLLLWLGPHVRMMELIKPIIAQVGASPFATSPDAADMIKTFQQIWQVFGERLNLLSFLRTYPIGIPSLMTGTAPLKTPYGAPIFVELRSTLGVFGLWIILSALGMFIGSVYFYEIARSTESKPEPYHWRKMTAMVLNTFVLSVTLLFMLLMVSIPVILMLSFMALISAGLAYVTTLFISIMAIWAVIPLLFSPHGIFTFGQNAGASLTTSVKFVRFNMGGTGLFFLIIVIFSQGMDVLWNLPGEDSWLSLIGIFGHAFITSGLVAASFVYYRDGLRWVKDLMLKATLSKTGSLHP